MRIAQMIDTLRWGGAQKMVLQLSDLLKRRGDEVTVISLGEDPGTPFARELRELGITVVHFPGGHLMNPGRILRLASYLRRQRFDVVQTYLIYANVVGVIAAKLAGVPVIGSIRNTQYDARYHHPIRSKIEMWLLRKWAERVMVNGYAIKDAWEGKLEGQRIDVIQNTVGLPALPSERERLVAREYLCGSPDRPIVISVGRISPPKGHSVLLDAFAMVRERVPDAFLVIVGDGKLRDNMEKHARGLGIEEHVRFTGTRIDVPHLLTASDLYVSASLWEGLSVAVLEGMAAGLPVVATAVGESPRMITPEIGRVVPPKNAEALAAAMIEYLCDPILSRDTGLRAREYVRSQYNPDRWLENFVALYMDVVAEKRKKAQK